jgi:hypothetical protein
MAQEKEVVKKEKVIYLSWEAYCIACLIERLKRRK